MKTFILPIVLAVAGTGAGAATGLFLVPPVRPAAVDQAVQCVGSEAEDHLAALPHDSSGHEGPSAFVALNNQFVVPLVGGDGVEALVILSLSLEVGEGDDDAVLSAEPRLRDAFLQVLFDHANTGGFEGAFTATETMRRLRLALTSAAQEILGDALRNVLIVDIVRQDI